MRPLKIALLSRWYAEEHRRLAGRGPVQQLAEAVAALGHEVVVLSQSREAAKLGKAAPGACGALEVWLSPRDRRRGGWTGLRDKLAKRRYAHRKVHSDALDLRDFLVARGPFDVLWAQCEEPDGLVAAVAEQEGVKLPPTLTQIHALRYTFSKNAVSVPLAALPQHIVPKGQKALAAAFTQATRIMANSELVADGPLYLYRTPELTYQQLQAKTRVIYPNLQTEFLEAARQPGMDGRAGRVLFLGALNEKKGALVFMNALRQVDANLNANFAMIGAITEENCDFDRAWARELAAVRASGAMLELLGKLPSNQVVEQIRRASLVVLPSLFDEFSRALAEALVLGRPVVTTEAVGAAILVHNSKSGVVVRPDDATDLARGINHVLGNLTLFTDNARSAAPRLAHELSPSALALQMARHLSEIVP